MAQLHDTFDATGVAPAAPLELLPPGRYPAQIVDSEMRATRTGTGQSPFENGLARRGWG